MRYLLIILFCSISFCKSSLYAEAEVGLGNIHHSNLLSGVIGFHPIDEIEFNFSMGFLPYQPSIGSSFLLNIPINNNMNALIGGIIYNINWISSSNFNINMG